MITLHMSLITFFHHTLASLDYLPRKGPTNIQSVFMCRTPIKTSPASLGIRTSDLLITGMLSSLAEPHTSPTSCIKNRQTKRPRFKESHDSSVEHGVLVKI